MTEVGDQIEQDDAEAERAAPAAEPCQRFEDEQRGDRMLDLIVDVGTARVLPIS